MSEERRAAVARDFEQASDYSWTDVAVSPFGVIHSASITAEGTTAKAGLPGAQMSAEKLHGFWREALLEKHAHQLGLRGALLSQADRLVRSCPSDSSVTIFTGSELFESPMLFGFGWSAVPGSAARASIFGSGLPRPIIAAPTLGEAELSERIGKRDIEIEIRGVRRFERHACDCLPDDCTACEEYGRTMQAAQKRHAEAQRLVAKFIGTHRASVGRQGWNRFWVVLPTLQPDRVLLRRIAQSPSLAESEALPAELRSYSEFIDFRTVAPSGEQGPIAAEAVDVFTGEKLPMPHCQHAFATHIKWCLPSPPYRTP